jgi:hypothetical protein
MCLRENGAYTALWALAFPRPRDSRPGLGTASAGRDMSAVGVQIAEVEGRHRNSPRAAGPNS